MTDPVYQKRKVWNSATFSVDEELVQTGQVEAVVEAVAAAPEQPAKAAKAAPTKRRAKAPKRKKTAKSV